MNLLKLTLPILLIALTPFSYGFKTNFVESTIESGNDNFIEFPEFLKLEKINDIITINVKVLPVDATDKRVNWSISNSSCVQILHSNNSFVQIKYVKEFPNKIYLTATTFDNKFSKSCTLTCSTYFYPPDVATTFMDWYGETFYWRFIVTNTSKYSVELTSTIFNGAEQKVSLGPGEKISLFSPDFLRVDHDPNAICVESQFEFYCFALSRYSFTSVNTEDYMP